MKRTVELSEAEVSAFLKDKFDATDVTFKFAERVIEPGDWRDPPITQTYIKSVTLTLKS